MRASHLPLSPQEIALFRALIKPAPVYLLILRLGRSVTTREIAGILTIPEQTVARSMQALLSLGLVDWDEQGDRYSLIDGHRLILRGTSQSAVQQEIENNSGDKNHEFSQDPASISQVWRELFSAGVSRNPRTRALVRQLYVTPEYVRAHRLKLVACGKSGPQWAGLLVTILESGEPAPPLNPNGHLESCRCLDCHGYRISRSWEDF